jgi:phosphinothricin acetyltransferase
MGRMSAVRPPLVRPATPADLPAINDIYNHYVLHSTATYQDEPDPLEARRAWFDRHGPDHPITVAEADGRIVGWGSLSPFHARSAYRRTVEDSVYVHHEHHRQGIGRVLLEDLIARAAQIGHHTIIGLIDGSQAPSIALHERLGFTRVAHLREVGFKFERWLDVVYVQLVIGGRP